MLEKIKFESGSVAHSLPLEINVTPITIFVGPNNSGKSRALIDIELFVKDPNYRQGKVINSIELIPMTEDEFTQEIQSLKVSPENNETLSIDHVIISRIDPQSDVNNRIQINLAATCYEAQHPNDGPRYNYSSVLSLFTLRLDGKSRLTLTEIKKAGDLQKKPENHITYLFQNNELRAKLRQIVFEAFSKYLVIDPTNMGNLRLRLSPRAPISEDEERGWEEKSVSFHNQATLIDDASDGVKAFVGILATIIAGNPKITLIDEPEAFLHPSLSAKLGKEITNIVKQSKNRLFISTHSASFLMGCVQGDAPMNIVRLTYDNPNATARVLNKEKLTPMMRNPLLRSIGVLNALFYNAVIVTEADADRAFYQEINERLLSANDERGINGCLFLNAQSKQTVWDIVGPLRELGIPAIGIVDIDVIKDGGVVWQKPLKGAFIPEIMHKSLCDQRKTYFDAFKESDKDMKRDGGINILSNDDKEAFLNFLETLSQYGVFIVPNGEIESWLSYLEFNRNKGSWLANIFEFMGEDPNDINYVKPQNGDVWDFIGKMKMWILNQNRKGIPE